MRTWHSDPVHGGASVRGLAARCRRTLKDSLVSLLTGPVELQPCEPSAMIGGLRKRTKLGFGIKKKERDADSVSSQEGDSTACLTKQKLCNATANGFLGDIDWQRYTSPELDADGYSLPPTWQPESRDPHSSSDSDDESSVPLHLNISIRPPEDSPAATPTPGQLWACVRCLPPPPSALRIPEAIDESEPELPKAPLAREESGSSVASDCSHVATTTNPPLPVAVAITETVHAYFKAKFILQVTGEMIFSFPIEAPTRLATCSAPLTFFLHHTQHIKHPLLHSRILHRVPELDDKANMAFQFDIPALIEQLQELSRKEQAKNHFNITALKYKVDNHEPREAPIILSPHWTYEQAGIIQLTVKYRYNPNAFETPSDLHDVQFVTHIEGDVTSVQATPPAVWHAKQRQITWKLPELQNNNHVTGMLIAKCELKGKPGPPRVMAVRFSSDGASCSGVEVNTGSHSNFKLALVKKSVHSGRYLADACNEEIDNKDK
uniref:F-BAR domain only protein 2-like n=1 Tax=Myxine glutinosa TaxID=7769 RepID=UPI00358F35F9